MGAEFRQVFDEQNLGVPLREALTGMTRRVDSLDAKFFSRRSSSSGRRREPRRDHRQDRHVIRERFRIQGQLKIFTAQARMTGLILTFLPVGVALAIVALIPTTSGRSGSSGWEVPDRPGRLHADRRGLVIRKIIRIKI